MRKIMTKEEFERKRRKNQITVGLILVFLMVASTLGYAIQGNLGNPQGVTGSSNVTYNGFEFSYVNGFWKHQNFVFRNNPRDVPNIDAFVNGIQSYEGKTLYVQSSDDVSLSEVYVNLGQIASSVQEACLQGAACLEGTPVKTCSDNFIVINEGADNKIAQSEKCVYIEGKKENLVKLTDEFLFKTLGIK